MFSGLLSRMERLRQLQEQQGDMADVDVEMFGRLESVDGDAIVGVIDRVELSEDGRNRKWLVVEVDTFVGMEQDRFPIPDIPQDSHRIVRLCKSVGVDPKFPSQLEGCEVRWDGNEIIVPEFGTKKDAVRDVVSRFFDGNVANILSRAAFVALFPITAACYLKLVPYTERIFELDTWGDYFLGVLLWTLVSMITLAGFIELLLV